MAHQAYHFKGIGLFATCKCVYTQTVHSHNVVGLAIIATHGSRLSFVLFHGTSRSCSQGMFAVSCLHPARHIKN